MSPPFSAPERGMPPHSGVESPGASLDRLVLLFLAARLIAWAFLLPPFEGFDEPFHLAYIEVSAERPVWPAFGSLGLPEGLVAEVRSWPREGPIPHVRLPPATRDLRAGVFRGAPNHEAQQPPLYYFLAGRLLAALPRISEIGEMYLFRLINAALALAIGILTLKAARALGMGECAFLAVAVLAFVPGFSLALVRVANDALCAFFFSLAVIAALTARGAPVSRRRAVLWGSLSGGLAPWAKLYGWAAVFPLAWRFSASRPRRLAAVSLLLLFLPGALLAYFSWKIHGQPLPLLESLRPGPDSDRTLLDVPWVRGYWGIAKTWIWVSGASSMVFPNALYLLLLLPLAAGFLLTLRRARSEKEDLLILLLPVIVLLLAMAYHSWKITAAYGPGASVGWYLWAAALPESLLLVWGACRGARLPRALPIALFLFFLTTVLSDLVLFSMVSGGLLTTPKRHLLGIEAVPPGDLWRFFLDSRPGIAASVAVFCALGSWLLGALILAQTAALSRRVRRAEREKPAPPIGPVVNSPRTP